ncbi:Uncharacterised protein [Enterobacter cloacae]|nr:Uncharacterised protein [Enterobacter cloacae]
MLTLQRVAQCRNIDHRAARGVDQQRARLHQRQLFRPHHVFGGRIFRHVQADHVAHIQQIREMLHLRRVTQRQLAFDIVEKHVHAEGFRQNTELRTDVAVTDNPELFTTRFERARSQLIPHAAVRFSVSFRNAAKEQQQLANHQLRHGTGVRERRVKDRDTAFGGGIQINLVGADAETANRHQLFRRSNNVFSQLGTGSQANEMGITDGRFQLFSVQRAFVKFDVGVACCAKAIERFLVHAFNQQEFNLVFLQ